MDLNEKVKESVDKIIAEKLTEKIDNSIDSLLNSILRDLFSEYGDFSKGIKKKIEEKLDVNLHNFDLVDYNVLISNAINKGLVKTINENNVEPIQKLIAKTVGFVKNKKIKLSEIHEMCIEAAREESYEDSGEITFLLEENYQKKWTSIFISFDKDTDKDKCEIKFIVSNDGSHRIFSFNTSSYWHDSRSITPATLAMLDNLQHKIFRLYSAAVEIEIDETYFENEWYKYDD